MDIALRQATTADIPVIRDLAHRIWWAHYPDIITPEQIEYMLGRTYSAESLSRQMREEGQQFWLIETGGQCLGYMSLGAQEEAGAYFLHKFYIDNSNRGKGVGIRAFGQMLERYPDLRLLRLVVNKHNFKSVNFYFKVGFIIEKCVVTEIGKGYIMDDFQMVFKQK